MNVYNKTREDKINFLRNFAKLNLSKICLDLGISRQVIYSKEISDEKLDLTVKKLIEELNSLWEK